MPGPRDSSSDPQTQIPHKTDILPLNHLHIIIYASFYTLLFSLWPFCFILLLFWNLIFHIIWACFFYVNELRFDIYYARLRFRSILLIYIMSKPTSSLLISLLFIFKTQLTIIRSIRTHILTAHCCLGTFCTMSICLVHLPFEMSAFRLSCFITVMCTGVVFHFGELCTLFDCISFFFSSFRPFP